MKKIPLTQGKFALVDDEDFAFLSTFKWHYERHPKTPVKDSSKKNGYRNVRMGVLINKTPPGLVTQHVNGDTLDNRRANLRSVTRSQMAHSFGIPRHNTSGAKGVCWSKKDRKFYAYTRLNGKRFNLGGFQDVESAVRRLTTFYSEV